MTLACLPLNDQYRMPALQPVQSAYRPRTCPLGVASVIKGPSVTLRGRLCNCCTASTRWQQHIKRQLKALPSHQQTTAGLRGEPRGEPRGQQTREAPAFNPQDWDEHAPAFLAALGLALNTSPSQLWQHFHDNISSEHQQQQLQEQLQQHLDLQSCRLLLTAATTTCYTQQQFNQLRPLIQAVPSVYHDFELADFTLLLDLCARARYIPDKEGLAAMVYADTGGFERFYHKSPADDVVHLIADLSAVFASNRQLLIHTQQHIQHLQQYDKQEQQQLEAEALQAAFETSTANLMAIQEDQLLAGELSALCGYWLVRHLLPQLATGDHTGVAVRGFRVLQELRYQVLDSAEADNLLRVLTLHLPTLNPKQLAAVLSSTLPCLGAAVPTDDSSLALLFAAAGAAARAGMGAHEAGHLLVVLAGLSRYAPDAEVAQALLDCALQPPLTLNPRQLDMLLASASEIGAAPRQHQLQLIGELLQVQQSPA